MLAISLQVLTEMHLGILSKSYILSLNKQLNQKCFYHHIINLSYLTFIKSIVYFERKFVLSLQMSYSDNAGFKIIIFSFAWKSGHLEWKSLWIISLSLHLRDSLWQKRHYEFFQEVAALWCLPQYLDAVPTDLQVEVFEFFNVLQIFSKFSWLSSLSLLSYHLVIRLTFI